MGVARQFLDTWIQIVTLLSSFFNDEYFLPFSTSHPPFFFNLNQRLIVVVIMPFSAKIPTEFLYWSNDGDFGTTDKVLFFTE